MCIPRPALRGFRYFDSRDLLGFVDGTENPTGSSMAEASLVGDEDPGFAGASYVVVQKYLHNLAGWASLSTEQQELVIGRDRPSSCRHSRCSSRSPRKREAVC